MPAGPSPLGFAYFVGVKCVGYIAAAYVIRKFYPDTESGPVKIGLARTAIGVGVGLAYGGLWILLAHNLAGQNDLGYLIGLLPVRLGEWLLLLHLFFDRGLKERPKALKAALGGSIWSFCLDAIGIAAAFVIPGGFWVC